MQSLSFTAKPYGRYQDCDSSGTCSTFRALSAISHTIERRQVGYQPHHSFHRNRSTHTYVRTYIANFIAIADFADSLPAFFQLSRLVPFRSLTFFLASARFGRYLLWKRGLRRAHDHTGRIMVLQGMKGTSRMAERISQGKTVFGYARLMLGEKAISHTVQNGGKLTLPRNFWPGCCKHCFHRVSSDALRQSLKKALSFYIRALRKGATTMCGMQGGAYAGQRRSKKGWANSLKCTELGQLLYDWFLECLYFHKARVTNHLIMARAREIHARLVSGGYQPHLMPNLMGESGKSWFRRWRRRFHVRACRKVRHLKVSWSKLKERIKVFLKNVFALRFLWRLCFGDAVEMRWLSLDQKPCWFNNTALDGSYTITGYQPRIREVFAASRQRFSICTFVDTESF